MLVRRWAACRSLSALFSLSELAGAAAAGELQTSMGGIEEVTQEALGVARDAVEAGAFVARAPRWGTCTPGSAVCKRSHRARRRPR